MKRLFLILLLLASSLCSAQQVHPNISYGAQLTSACTNANSACSGAVFVGGPSSYGVLGSGPTLDVPVSNYNAAVVTVSCTYSGITLAFDFSDPTGGTNYFQEVCARTDINLLETGETLPSNQIRAWNCPVWGNTRFRVRASAYSSGSANIWITLTEAAIDPSLVVAASTVNIAGASDPCLDTSAIKSSAAVNLSSAATTALVALAASKSIYVCGYSISILGLATTAGTIKFEYGTQTSTACDTGTTVLTGAFFGSTTAGGVSQITGSGDATQFSAASGNQLCAVTTGTSPNFQGVVSYVQQ